MPFPSVSGTAPRDFDCFPFQLSNGRLFVRHVPQRWHISTPKRRLVSEMTLGLYALIRFSGIFPFTVSQRL